MRLNWQVGRSSRFYRALGVVLLFLASLALAEPAGAQQGCSAQDECCGNRICDPGEDFESCPEDCFTTCGNGMCQPARGETYETCPVDCTCGNGVCNLGETETCPADCEPICIPTGCEGRCGPQKDCGTPIDCGPCSTDCPNPNGVCELELEESTELCGAIECPETCGNGQCDLGEHSRCPSDCTQIPCSTTLCAAGCAARPTFSIVNPQPAVNETVGFDAFPTYIVGSLVNWDFGDGQHCDGCPLSVTHAYSQPGTYPVRLTASENVCQSTQVSYPQYVAVDSTQELVTGDGAGILSSTVPSCMVPGQQYSVVISMRNTGTTSWSAANGYKLGVVGGPDPFTAATRVDLPTGLVIGPLGWHRFALTLHAPSSGNGIFVTRWQMLREGVTWFGDKAQHAVRVSPSCEEPPPTGDYRCEVSIKDQDNKPVPDQAVSFTAFTYAANEEASLVGLASGATNAIGQVTLVLPSGPQTVQRLVCKVLDLKATTPTVKQVTDAVAIPSGTTLRLDLIAVGDTLGPVFPGLKEGVSRARLYQSGAYDKPVIIANPFDFQERTPEGFTAESLQAVFARFLSVAYDLKYDVWLVKTRTGQNIHEQAAEFAQAIDYAANRLGPEGKVIALGYSLGGLTTRLATARYQADAAWRADLRVRDTLHASLVGFGDAPLTGGQANFCSQRALWEDLPHGAETTNLRSCGAQQLLRRSYANSAEDYRQNSRNFLERGQIVTFRHDNDKNAPCDLRQGGLCECDPGPAVVSVNGDGFPHGMPVVAFSDGMPGPATCYGDSRDLDSSGLSVCPGVSGPFGSILPYPSYPWTHSAGDRMLKIRVPKNLLPIPALDYDCHADSEDVQGGSRYALKSQKDCYGDWPVCGGVQIYFNGTFIPYDSALPPGSNITKAPDLGFQGVHGKGYTANVLWLFQRMGEVSPASDETMRRTTGVGSVTVTVPDTSQAGDTQIRAVADGPFPPPNYVGIDPATYYEISSTRVAGPSFADPVDVCIEYSASTVMYDKELVMFQFQNMGWVDITSLRDTEDKRICGSTPTLQGAVALFEPVNHTPLANAGPDRSFGRGQTDPEVALNGGGSGDDDGEPLSYEWRDGSGMVVGTTASTKLPLGLGTYSFTLEVKDPRGASSTDSVTVVVEPDQPPTVSVSSDGACAPPCTITFSASANDPNGGPLTYAWSGCASGTGTAATCSMPTAGTVTATITVTDPAGSTASASATATAAPQVAVSSLTLGQGATIAVTVTGGPGNTRDWVGMHAVNAADTTYLGWAYLNGSTTAPTIGMTSALLKFTVPTTPGSYDFRLFRDGGYTKLASSPVVSVASLGPRLSVGATTADAGTVVQVTLTSGPGGTGDWIGLYGANAPGRIDWKYLNGTQSRPAVGLTSTTIPFTMPTTAGAYDFRLVDEEGLMVLATSPTVAVPASGTSLPAKPVPIGPYGCTPASRPVFSWYAAANADSYKFSIFRDSPETLVSFIDVTPTSYAYVPGDPGYTELVNGVLYRWKVKGLKTSTGQFGPYSPSIYFQICPGTLTPSLTASASTAYVRQAVQVTLANGPGNVGDWVGLYLRGAVDEGPLDWKYLNGTRAAPTAGRSAATLAFQMPSTPGTYDLRLFANNSYAKLATSGAIVVDAEPAAALGVTPTSLAFGSVTLGSPVNRVVTVRNTGGGTLTGSAAITGTGFTLVGSAAYSLAADQTSNVTVRFAPATSGAASGTLTLTGGAGATVPLSATAVNPPPTITAASATVSPGGTLQVAIANGPGNATDWVGFYATGAANTASLDWKYLNNTRTAPTSGLTSANLTFTVPTTPGTYELRLLPTNSYVDIARTGVVTVTTPASLTVNATTVAPGATVQVILTNGPGNATDWVSIGSAAGADGAYLDWRYLNGTKTAPAAGLTSATVAFTMPATTGTYNFRLFQSNTYSKLATSPTVTVQVAASVTVSATTAAPGATVQVTVTNGPGNPSDWLGMHATTAADNAYLAWKYLSGTTTQPATGLTTATVNFTVPWTPGTYNFRFFQGSNTKLATSPTVTVQ